MKLSISRRILNNEPGGKSFKELSVSPAMLYGRNLVRMYGQVAVSHSKKRINLPHFAFSRGCILIADIYTHYVVSLYSLPPSQLCSAEEKKLTKSSNSHKGCGHFSMDVIKTFQPTSTVYNFVLFWTKRTAAY